MVLCGSVSLVQGSCATHSLHKSAVWHKHQELSYLELAAAVNEIPSMPYSAEESSTKKMSRIVFQPIVYFQR